MLSCARAIGQLSKVTRHTHANHSYRPLRYVGIFGVSRSWYSNNANNNKPYKSSGATIKPEECVPSSRYSKPKKPLPACETRSDASCPSSCSTSCSSGDGQKGSNGKNGKFPNWKHLLVTLIIAGVTIYVISFKEWFTDIKDSKTDTKKKKRFSEKT